MSCLSMHEAKYQLPTPALVIAADVVRANIARLAQYARHAGLHVRPHAKTSKSRFVMERQREAGAVGFAAAKVSEAAAISRPADDLLVAYPPVDVSRASQLAGLAKDRTVRASIDSDFAIDLAASAAQRAGVTIGLLVELDVGLHRTGAQTPSEATALAERIDQTRGVRLDGILAYPGHIWNLPEEQGEALACVSAALEETLELWSRRGLAATIVSGGSTPTAFQSHLVPQYTEIRPGTYVYNDMNTVRGGYCQLVDCAARVACTVISTSVHGQAVVDAGSKVLSSDLCLPAPHSGYGHVVELPEAKITKLSEEHGRLDVSACSRTPRVGERLTVIPNHICPCVNLSNTAWWIEPDAPPRQLSIEARGATT